MNLNAPWKYQLIKQNIFRINHLMWNKTKLSKLNVAILKVCAISFWFCWHRQEKQETNQAAANHIFQTKRLEMSHFSFWLQYKLLIKWLTSAVQCFCSEHRETDSCHKIVSTVIYSNNYINVFFFIFTFNAFKCLFQCIHIVYPLL